MLIDGAGLWFRAFYALPDSLTSPDGRPVNAVRGFFDMVATLIEQERPSRVVVCLDEAWRPAFRTDLIPSYKAHRVAADGSEDAPDAIGPQVPMILNVLDALGMTAAGSADCEADDIIGTLAATERVDPVIVVSGDRDLLQVASDEPPTVVVRYVGRGLNRSTTYDPAGIAAAYGVPTERAGAAYAELAILRGDPSDGLPGVAGIGEKTASKLLLAHGSLDAIEAAAAAGQGVPPRNAAAIINARDYLRAARTVVFVRADAEVSWYGPVGGALPNAPADTDALDRLTTDLGIEASVARMRVALGW